MSILGDELFNRPSILEVGSTEPWVDSSGDSVVDVHGTAGIGTMKRGDGTTSSTFPTYSRDGLWDFDGGDYFDCGDNDTFSFSLSDKFSIGCFFIFPSLADAAFIAKGDLDTPNVGEYILRYENSQNAIEIVFIDEGDGGYNLVRSSANQIVAGKLHSLVMSFNGGGSISVANVGIFLDRVDISSTLVTSGTFNSIDNTTQNLVLGSYSDKTSYLLTGKLGYPFIKPYQMSQQQIRYWDTVTRRRMGIRL